VIPACKSRASPNMQRLAYLTKVLLKNALKTLDMLNVSFLVEFSPDSNK